LIYLSILTVAVFYVIVLIGVLKKKRTLLYMLPIISAALVYGFVNFLQSAGYAIPDSWFVDLPPISHKIGKFEYISGTQAGNYLIVMLVFEGDNQPRLVRFPYSDKMAREMAEAEAEKKEKGTHTSMQVHYNVDGFIQSVTSFHGADPNEGQFIEK
jgi:hypothetical protein